MTTIVMQSNASGTGSITFSAPDTNINRTLTLPDASGSLLESSNPVISQLNGGQLAGFRNKIINGKMDIAQRGTSFAGISTASYALDRWFWTQSGSGNTTMTQQLDAPSNNEFQNSLRNTVTTADASIAATDVYAIRQRIEGFNIRDLIGKTFTLSFWVRSSKTGTHCVSFQNSGFNRVWISEYTVAAANTWEQKSITISGGLITAGTWDWTTGLGLDVSWALAAGSNYQTTAGSWVTPGDTSGRFATANQVNCLDTIGNIFAITGVQLEVGSVATPFEQRPIGVELALCQRYYETTNVSVSGAAFANMATTAKYAVVKRASPTVTRLGNWATTSEAGTLVSANNPGEFYLYNPTASATAAGGQYTANAEL